MTPRDNISNGNVSGNEQQNEKSYENHQPKKLTIFGIYQGLDLTKNVKFKANMLFWNVAGLSSTEL